MILSWARLCWTRLTAKTRLALGLSAEEATQWCWLGFQLEVEDDSQDQRSAVLQICKKFLPKLSQK